MSNAIQLQTDIGGLGIQGLGALSTVLSTLSADNVAPMAVVQMENLGALFHINGTFAERVPDMLKRFSSQPLGRLAMSIGWRRGDSASLMADSSGGQAIALLSLCLTNLFSPNNVAMILHRICNRVLAKSVNIASISQLGGVANILGGKLQVLGFGNYLAQQVMKVHSIYEQLGARLPDDLLSPLTNEAMVDLLECFTRVFSADNAILRVTGLTGMGYVLALVLFMFPNDVLVTAESFVIHDGSNAKKCITMEFSQTSIGPLRVRVEKELKIEPDLELPIDTACTENLLHCSFSWHGWMARTLELTLSSFGLARPEELRIACCDLLIAVASETDRTDPSPNSSGLPRGGLIALLGDYPIYRMERVCEEILLVRPSTTRMTVLSSFAVVASIFSDLAKNIDCHHTATCDFKKGWVVEFGSDNCCRRRSWSMFGSLLDRGAQSFLINAGPNTTTSSAGMGKNLIATSLINWALGVNDYPHFAAQHFYKNSLHFSSYYAGGLAPSSSSCTIYATILKSLRVPSSLLRTFELVEGQLMYDGRYHTALESAVYIDNRPKAARSIVYSSKPAEPSNIGQHSQLSITIVESLSALSMKATARYAGMNLYFAISSIIGAYFGLTATDRCSHPPLSPLNKRLKKMVRITSIASPRPEGDKIGLLMTKSNPTAQLLGCQEKVKALFLRDCCLNCAVQQAKDGKFHQIIVA